MLADLELARRLDSAEGSAAASFIDARDGDSAWQRIGGAYVLFDGPGSPMSQTFALGLHQPVTGEMLDEIEAFFFARQAPADHDTCPIAAKEFLPLLAERGYRAIEMSSTMYLPLAAWREADRGEARVEVRLCGRGEQELWARTATAGWSAEVPELADTLFELMSVAARREAPLFLAELDGEPIGAASYYEHEGVVVLAGASTVPSARKQGAQRALLAARMRYAIDSGCDLAMMCAEPGSGSQRNGERQGFRIAYTRTKWRREP